MKLYLGMPHGQPIGMKIVKIWSRKVSTWKVNGCVQHAHWLWKSLFADFHKQRKFHRSICNFSIIPIEQQILTFVPKFKRLSKTTLSPSPKPSSKENHNKTTLEDLYSLAASPFLNVQQSDRCGTCITMNLAVSVQEQVSIHVYKNFLFI